MRLKIKEQALKETAVKGNVMSHVLSADKQSGVVNVLEYLAIGVMQEGTITEFMDYPYAVPYVGVDETGQHFSAVKSTAGSEYGIDYFSVKFGTPRQKNMEKHKIKIMETILSGNFCVFHSHPGSKEFSDKDVEDSRDKDIPLELVLNVPKFMNFEGKRKALSFVYNGNYVRTKMKDIQFEEPYKKIVSDFEQRVKIVTVTQPELKTEPDVYINSIGRNVNLILDEETAFIDSLVKNPEEFMGVFSDKFKIDGIDVV